MKSLQLLLCAVASAGLFALTLTHPEHVAAAETGEPAIETVTPAPSPAPEPPAPAPAPPPVVVQPSLSPEMAQRVTRLASDVETAAKGIERVKDRENGLAAQRDELDRIEIEAQQVITALKPKHEAVAAQLQKLGPPPAKDAAPEAPAIAAERSQLSAHEAEIAGAIKTAELALVRARQLVGHVQDLRQALFARDLLIRSGSILATSTWQHLSEDMPRAGRQIKNLALDWWNGVRPQWPLLLLILAATAGAYLATRWILPRLQRRLQSTTYGLTSFFPRAGNASWAVALHALPPLAAAGTLYGGLVALDLLTLTVGEFALAALLSFAIYMAVSAVAEVAFGPGPTGVPLADIADASAPKLLRLARVFAAVAALDLLLSAVVKMLYLPLEVGVAQASLTSLAFAAMLIAFVRVPLARREVALLEPIARSHPRWLKLPITLLAIIIIVTTLTGYVALGRFISKQVILVGGTALALMVAHLAIRRIASALIDGERPVGRILEARLGLDHERTGYVTRSIVFMLELVLLVAALPFLLMSWGYSQEDILDWLKLAIFGFEIGQFRISLARILVAVLFFLGLLFVTRVIQRWLDTAVLGPARVDRSISHSVLTGVGYAGVALATILALSYAGLDFTHLAIVAGALSVGIGFGLQAIFNNLVSGIILLVERPIKVGDWIVVNGQEGYVRRINVRATEIETFDRASLIIPNSVLITGAVTNFTHRNAIGRVMFHVGVSYDSDPERVLEILNRVVGETPGLLKQPAPFVRFDNFGDSALIFLVGAFVPDVNQRGTAASNLRIAIAKAFREEGIEIPYPQHDIHLRDLDGVRQAFSRVLEARRQEQEMKKAAETSADTQARPETPRTTPAPVVDA